MPPSCSSHWLSCLPAFLSLGSLLLSPLSLLCLFPLPGSAPLVLRAFSCLMFFFFSVALPPWSLHLLLRVWAFCGSCSSSLGRVISYDFFVYGQARQHAPGSCCCSLFAREGLRLCLLFLIPCSVCVGVSPLPRSFRVPSSRISWGLFRVGSYSVWFGLCGSLCAVLLLFLRVLALSWCLLVVLLALFPRLLCPSFSVVSFSSLSLHLLPLLFLLPLLRPLRVLLLPFLRCWAVRVSSRCFSLGQVVSASAVV